MVETPPLPQGPRLRGSWEDPHWPHFLFHYSLFSTEQPLALPERGLCKALSPFGEVLRKPPWCSSCASIYGQRCALGLQVRSCQCPRGKGLRCPCHTGW
jgi:hypothetical protein